MPDASLHLPAHRRENQDPFEASIVNPWSEAVPNRGNVLEILRIVVGLLLSFCLLINVVLLALGLVFSIAYAVMQELSRF